MSFYGAPKYRDCDFQKYDKVRVVTGRKVPVGTEGEVFWISEPLRYGQSRFATTTFKVGIKDEQGNVHWTYDKNVKLLEREGRPATHDGLRNVIWPTPELFSDR